MQIFLLSLVCSYLADAKWTAPWKFSSGLRESHLAADAQHLAVIFHGLNEILLEIVLHNYLPPNMGCGFLVKMVS